MKILYILFFLTSLSLYSQNDSDLIEIKAISETLPSYLDRHPGSAISYARGNYNYKVIRNYMTGLLNIGIVSDSIDRIGVQNQLDRLDFVADSLENVLLNKKIKVRVIDSIYTYDYVPKEFYDLRINEDWRNEQEYLKEEFTTNRWNRLDTIISIEFVDLIKLQIDLSKKTTKINISELSNENYEFINLYEECEEKELCIYGYKIYRPVFNKEKNKGCYLFSDECESKCREFIFIEKKGNRWNFVESYSSHLIGNEE